MPFASDSVKNGVDILVRQRIDPPELCMKVGAVIGNFRQGVIDLVETWNRLIGAEIFHGDPAMFPERHLPETVHAAVRVDGYGK